MKIQIDTSTKTIKLESIENIEKFFKVIQKLFPNGEWKEYKLDTNTVINNWSNPIVITSPYINPNYPLTYSYYTFKLDSGCETTVNNNIPFTLTGSTTTFNIEA